MRAKPPHKFMCITRFIAPADQSAPPNQHFIEVTIPAGTSYEVVTADILPDWCTTSGTAARRFGHQWYEENRSAILLVPSVVARMERNVVINSRHADFNRLTAGLETPVWWDRRLFA